MTNSQADHAQNGTPDGEPGAGRVDAQETASGAPVAAGHTAGEDAPPVDGTAGAASSEPAEHSGAPTASSASGETGGTRDSEAGGRGNAGEAESPEGAGDFAVSGGSGDPEGPQESGGPEGGEEEGTRRLAQAVQAAEQALIEFEIAVETFRVEVDNFSRLHHQRLGPMYARLDELQARIAEAVAARTQDPDDLRRAQEARAMVQPMPNVEELFHGWMGSDGLYPEAQAMLTGQSVQPPGKVRPSEEARRVYRDLVRRAHPDLAADERERGRRDEFMARANAAYARGDEAALRALTREWEAGPPPQPRPLSRAEELYARLEWLAERKEMLAGVARELEEGAIGAMLRMAPDDPDALLDEIAEKLLAEVAEREAELAGLVG